MTAEARRAVETPLYDAFDDYDLFVDWDSRLASELPFLERVLREIGARRVLDAACGSGRHAVALASMGYALTGADPSATMLRLARGHAEERGVAVDWQRLGFGCLASELTGPYDAVLCLGNSLPHALYRADLEAALRDWHTLLRPGGLLLIQQRNFDRVLARRERYMSPEAWQGAGEERLFWRFYDWEDDEGLLQFNVVRLRRSGEQPWQARVDSTRLRAWRREELLAALAYARLALRAAYGDLRGAPYQEFESGDLVLLAERTDR